MQIDAFGAALGGQFGHGQDVVFVAVHATRRQQAQQMDCLAGAHGGVDGVGQDGVVGQLVVFDGLVMRVKS